MKVTVMLIVIVALGTIPKCLMKGLDNLEFREQEEIIQRGDLLSHNLRWNTIS